MRSRVIIFDLDLVTKKVAAARKDFYFFVPLVWQRTWTSKREREKKERKIEILPIFRFAVQFNERLLLLLLLCLRSERLIYLSASSRASKAKVASVDFCSCQLELQLCLHCVVYSAAAAFTCRGFGDKELKREKKKESNERTKEEVRLLVWLANELICIKCEQNQLCGAWKVERQQKSRLLLLSKRRVKDDDEWAPTTRWSLSTCNNSSLVVCVYLYPLSISLLCCFSQSKKFDQRASSLSSALLLLLLFPSIRRRLLQPSTLNTLWASFCQTLKTNSDRCVCV